MVTRLLNELSRPSGEGSVCAPTEIFGLWVVAPSRRKVMSPQRKLSPSMRLQVGTRCPLKKMPFLLWRSATRTFVPSKSSCACFRDRLLCMQTI